MPYAEIDCTTNFSFLQGASHPEELVIRAAELGYSALAITDEQSLAGVVRAHAAANSAGLKLLVGARIRPVDAPEIVLLATDRASYGRLAQLITLGRRREKKGSCRLMVKDLADHAKDLHAAVSVEDYIATEATGVKEQIRSQLKTYHDIFGARCSLLTSLHLGRDDRGKIGKLQTLSRSIKIPLVASGSVLYHKRGRRTLHETLTAIRHSTTIKQIRTLLPCNAERHLRPIPEIHRLFTKAPEAISRAVEISDACNFSLDQLRYEYPEELVPQGITASNHLAALTWQGARWRYPQGIGRDVSQRIEHELALIGELHYETYFLTVWDLVQFARRHGILCQGRGSAANSVVCYCLGITSIDPARMDLLFERFVSRERGEAPDIDVDFEHERREEVLQYIYQKYGRERVGMTAEVITYRPRSAMRDAGRALGIDLETINRVAKSVSRGQLPDLETIKERTEGLKLPADLLTRWVQRAGALCGFPRHLSQHVGGMVMTRGPLCELVPIENAAMPGRTVIEWNKDDLDTLGILKVDCLSLGMLTAIRKAFTLIEKHSHQRWTLATVPAGDTAVYDMICEADTVGVFQIESRAQMSMLPRLRPRNFYDLVIEVAIVRPGPIQGDMVHPYLRRRHGIEPVRYPSEEIRKVLEKTLGIPLFQEQAMRLAITAADFTPGQADALRRAMGAWRSDGSIDPFQRQLVDGMRKRGYDSAYCDELFSQLRSFSLYGFPESHAASFALLVYVSAWLKHHHPAAFTAALLNSQPMGFYAPAQLVQDCRKAGVEVRPVDVNRSLWDCTLEAENQSLALRLGFRMIRGIKRSVVQRIVACRDTPGTPNPYRCIQDFTHRTGFGRATVAQLTRADIFHSLTLDRRNALWNALAQEKNHRSNPLFEQKPEQDDSCDALTAPSEWEHVFEDYQTQGLSLRGHPISFFRKRLNAKQVVCCHDLKTHPCDRRVSVAGLVLNRQRPGTARGITFMTLEDETGIANLIVHEGTWKRFRNVANESNALIARGHLERKDQVIHLIVEKIEALQESLMSLGNHSRDFR